MIDLGKTRLRSNPLLRLIPYDRIEERDRKTFEKLAEEANFFDDQELRLLDELAADAAFAMEFAEQEAQRRQAESALREANETLEQRVAERTAELRAQQRQLRYFASLQEAVSDAVISTDLGFRIQSWNAAAERIYGWRADEVIGQRSPDLFKTEFAPGDSSEHILKEFQAHGFWTAEVVQRHKDGHAIPILGSMTLIKDAGDTAMGIVAVNHDITSWKQAEAALRESEARYRLLADHVSDLIARIDTMGVYVYISPSSQTMLGYTPEELVGKSGLELIHPDDVGEVIQQMQVALDPNGHVSPVTYRMLHKDGHYVWVETNGQIVWSEDRSEIIGFITMSRDVTERQRVFSALALGHIA